MTRINVVPPSELSDAWLIAEYRELPRVLKQHFNIKDASNSYKLGTGHVKWARKHALFLVKRFNSLVNEMKYRGFTPNYNKSLAHFLTNEICNDYVVTEQDKLINRQRLLEKYKINKKVYKWTKREKPFYLKEIL